MYVAEKWELELLTEARCSYSSPLPGNGGQNDHRSSTITDGPSVIGRIKRLTDGEMADAFHNLF